MADIQHASPTSATRCQGTTAIGQCRNESVNGTIYCAHHGGMTGLKKKIDRIYKLAQWNERVEHHADHTQLKNLREEIAILRMTLETRLNECTTNADLLLNSSTIVALVDKIERTVVSCHKLEHAMGQLLDKNALIQFSDAVINIIGEVFPNATTEQMSALGERLVRAVSSHELGSTTTTVDSESKQQPKHQPVDLDIDESND